jgi:pantothenate synthetase
LWNSGATNAQDLIASITNSLSQDPAVHVQYVSVVRKGTMEDVQTACENDVILAAVVVDGIRLIDNMSLISA